MKAFLTILIVLGVVGGGVYFFMVKPEMDKKAAKGDFLAAELAYDEVSGSAPKSSGYKTSTAPEKPKYTAPTKKPEVAKPAEKPAMAEAKPAAAEKPAAPAEPKPQTSDDKISDFVAKRYPMPEMLSLEQMTENWTKIPANAYTESVAATVPVDFDLVIDGNKVGSTSVPPGGALRPLAVKAGQIQVANLANATMKKVLQLDQTNFKQLVEEKYNKGVAYYKNRTMQAREKAKAALMADPELLASVTGEGGQEVATGPQDDPRFAPVKLSLKNGEASSVSLEEATKFRWNGMRKIKGDMAGMYDAVTVNFEVKTIFGKFPAEYMALLKGGKVVAWIDPITHEKI
ncbi:MAG: hypothetical protein AAF226_02155 [Verrucomicrobiota bacterium]